MTLREATLGTRRFDPLLVHCLARLGHIESELGERVAAERYMNRALDTWRGSNGPVHPQLVPTLASLGRWLAERRRCSEAMPLLRQALREQTARQRPASAEIAELKGLLTGCA